MAKIMVQTTGIIHNSAKIDDSVIIKGNVSIGENTYIAPGVIINATHGSIEISANTVIMENAIIRSSAKFDCTIGDNVLIGPKACITGATIHDACFIGTNATIFHGSAILSDVYKVMTKLIVERMKGLS